MRRIYPWVCRALVLIFAYLYFYKSMHAGYLGSEVAYLEKRSETMLSLARISWIGLPASVVNAWAEELKSQGATINSGEDKVVIGDFTFIFEESRVVSIDFPYQSP